MDFDDINDFCDDENEMLFENDFEEAFEVTGDGADIIEMVSSQLEGGDSSNLIFVALTVISGASALVANMRKKLKARSLLYINKAEEEFINQKKAGKIKRLYAVDELSKSVPALLRPFLGIRYAEKIIDTSFSDMNKFAGLQVKSTSSFICNISDNDNPLCRKCVFNADKY